MNPTGPIAARLEEELKQKIRQYGIVVWLDKSASYAAYADALAERSKTGDFPFPVIPFRGSFLEMMLLMETYENGIDPDPLLIHMPGHTEDSIRRTPMLEMYRAGYRHRRSLETLVREVATGKVPPDEIDAFIRTNPTDLFDAESWLSEKTGRLKEETALYLENLSLEWIIDGLIGENQEFRNRFTDPNALKILSDHLHRHTGMNPPFLRFFMGEEPLSFPNLREAIAAWLMCVEYVHDLTVPPHLEALKPLAGISDPLKKSCRSLLDHLRSRYPEAYAAHAMTAESLLHQEIDAHPPEALGRIDTFNREQERILYSAVHSLLEGEWEKVINWTGHRVETRSFWLNRDPVRRMTWTLIADAAVLGNRIEQSGRPLKGAGDFQEVLEYYTTQGWKIDNAHRRFEQQQMKLLDSKMPHFTLLHEAFGRLRIRYREWADALAEDFASLCEQEGFLPPADLRQREIFQRIIHPLLKNDQRVACFLLDAFRFEMAAELAHGMIEKGAQVLLKGRYAELPTITAVGMNALAPTADRGRLTLSGDNGFNGFKTGEYTVRRPEDRTRAMGDRSLDNVASGRKQTRGMELTDICQRSLEGIKKSCAGARLIVVHGREIDAAGGANVGTASFEVLLRQIRAAWNQLRAIGIQTFIFTADHGFLLNDHTVPQIPYGSKTTPDARYILAREPRAEAGMIPVSLTALNYEGQEGYLLFRRDTALFANPGRGESFVHGGNSLQERVIPVLTVSHRTSAHTGDTRYEITAASLPEVLGNSRIQILLADASQSQLKLTGAGAATLALRTPEREDIEVTLKEVIGASIENQAFRLKTDGTAVEILFDLKGPRDERARIEVFPVDSGETVSPVVVDGYFNVWGRIGAEGSQSPDESQAQDGRDWQENFEDPAIQRIFTHLGDHGAITEAELNGILGSPRKVRRFAAAFEEHAAKAPFSVRIETTPTGKRYVKT